MLDKLDKLGKILEMADRSKIAKEGVLIQAKELVIDYLNQFEEIMGEVVSVEQKVVMAQKICDSIAKSILIKVVDEIYPDWEASMVDELSDKTVH